MSDLEDKQAARILRAEMVRRGVDYADLRERLAARGLEVSESSLRNKVSRGTFAADFFLHCLAAMDVQNLRLTE